MSVARSSVTLAIAVCVSGRGSNLQALIDAIAQGRLDARIVYVASSRRNAAALERAARARIPHGAFPPAANGGRAAAQALMGATIAREGAELVVLAGFDRILSDAFFERLRGIPVINIHPSLLPAFGKLNGLAVHEAVLASGATVTGATVHRAHAGMLDEGEIVLQRRVPVFERDDAETLAARVLEAEHAILVEAVGRFAAGEQRAPVRV
jgi:phosphoribosylglycinamide formyltransferase-1